MQFWDIARTNPKTWCIFDYILKGYSRRSKTAESDVWNFGGRLRRQRATKGRPSTDQTSSDRARRASRFSSSPSRSRGRRATQSAAKT